MWILCCNTLKSQDSGGAVLLFLRITPRWAVSEHSTISVSRWQAGSNKRLLVPLISSLFLSDINYSCPAQHLEQTTTLQVANLSSSPGHTGLFSSTLQCREEVWDTLAVFKAYPSKTGILEVFSAAWGNIWEYHLAGSCSKYPQRAPINF